MRIVAHRGASRYAPENTFAAFELGVQMGADGLETDLRITHDGLVVLLHDARVDRTTTGRGHVRAMGRDEVRRLDAGGWFHPRFAGQSVPALDELLRRFGGRCELELELKTPAAAPPALASVRGARIRDGVTFTAFRFSTLRLLRLLDRHVALGWLRSRISPRAIAMLREIRGRQISPRVATLTPAQVRLCHGYGIEVRAWGIRGLWEMHHALRCGVDGMTIDFPDMLSRVLGRPQRPCSA